MHGTDGQADPGSRRMLWQLTATEDAELLDGNDGVFGRLWHRGGGIKKTTVCLIALSYKKSYMKSRVCRGVVERIFLKGHWTPIMMPASPAAQGLLFHRRYRPGSRSRLP